MSQKKNTSIRKQEIVQATLKVISARGINAVTVASIAEMAGMCEANIYRHFSSKDEIYFAVADFIAGTVMGKASIIAQHDQKSLERLETIYYSHMALIAENPGMPRFIFSEDIRLDNQKLAAKISSRLQNYVETMSKIISEGIKEGDLRGDISPRETALTLLGMIQSTALRWTNDRSDFDFMKEAKKLWLNFVKFVT